MSLLIDADNLCRMFAERCAVEALSLQLRPGAVLGLLGPNGAGKTTSMRMLSGVIAPSSGHATICGIALDADDTHLQQIRARCGLLPEAPGFYERLTAMENLQFFAGLHGIAAPLARRRAFAELERFQLTDRAHEPVATFSRGMKQRLSLARALLHAPSLLFLDEPTAGLDPHAQSELHARIRDLRDGGTGIVFSTHVLEEAELVCDDILLLDRRPLFFGRWQDLAGDAPLQIVLASPLATLPELPNGVQVIQHEASILRLACNDQTAQTPELVRRLVAAGAAITQVGTAPSRLRQHYLAMVRR